MDAHYKERFQRSIGIFTEAQLEKLRSKKIAVAGLGLGGCVFLNLVRLGFEKFHLADPDVNERTNINRQRMAKETTIGLRKDACIAQEAREINPTVELKLFRDGVKPHNVEDFLDGVDWVVDVVDLFAMDDKLKLNQMAYEKGIPVVSCVNMGFAGVVVQFDRSTPTFEELTGINSSLPYKENLARFLQFVSPEIPSYMADQLFKSMDGSTYIPFVPIGGEISAAFATSAIVKGLLQIGRRVVAPQGVYIDAMNMQLIEFTASHQARSLTTNDSQQKKAA